MEDGIVITDYYFKIPGFPWDLMGLTIPKVGSIHGNLAPIMAHFDQKQAYFLNGRPLMRELLRFSEQEGNGTAKDIYLFCLNHCESEQGIERLVLNFLERNVIFRKAFQIRMDDLWKQRRIWVPEVARRVK